MKGRICIDRGRKHLFHRGLIYGIISLALILVTSIIYSTTHLYHANAESPADSIRVKTNSDLTYYLKVNYDGIDKYGTTSSDNATADVRSGIIEVSDKIPDGLEFLRFETTESGRIGAALQNGNDSIACSGKVIDDTSTNGVWDTSHTEFTYHGLHYDASTRTVSFKVENLQAGCALTVGIVTHTPFLGNHKRLDFYNTASASEGILNQRSNTVHAWMGREDASLFTVSYAYTGDIPENAPQVPSTASYASGASVGISPEPILPGYKFSGWTTTDAEANNGSFIMPEANVRLVGSFDKKTDETKYKVSYIVRGDIPEGYVLPDEGLYAEGSLVTLDSTASGSMIDDYVFSGWTSSDAELYETGFTMPNHDVVISGSFERKTYWVRYAFEGDVLPPNYQTLLPEAQKYPAGQKVMTAENPEADGYRFLGWYKNSTFTMPYEDVEIFGEWQQVSGLFSPEISIDIVNPKEKYHKDDVVKFEITVKNTADFTINDVIVQELLDGALFIEGTGYTVRDDHQILVESLGAGESIVLYAEFPVTQNEAETVVNPVKLVGAIADNDYYLDTTKDYGASVEFSTEHQVTIADIASPLTNDPVLKYTIICIAATSCLAWLIYIRRKELRKIVKSRHFKRITPVVVLAFAVIGSVGFVGKTIAATHVEPIAAVELTSQFTSYANSEEGSWHIFKSAEWTGIGKARITFDVDTVAKAGKRPKDILLVLDISGSMRGQKLEKVKADVSDLITNYTADGQNRFAIVSFESDAQILSPFSDNTEDLIRLVNRLTDKGATNYYQGLLKAEEILRDYEMKPDRDTVLLFLTDGYPNKDTPNQIAEYEHFKTLYPSVTIVSVQYEMGGDVLEPIAQVSDQQFVADMFSLNNILYDAATLLERYDSFVIEDYINSEYWGIDNIESIQASIGEVSLKDENGTPKVTWNLGSNFRSGSSAYLTIDINLKDDISEDSDFFTTNQRETVSTKLIGVSSEDITSESTPVLKRSFSVSYKVNAPAGCSIAGTVPTEEKYPPHSTVRISSSIPLCEGYSFSGWSIVTDDVVQINDNTFRMPGKDVILRGVWTKMNIEKNMKGETVWTTTISDLSNMQEITRQICDASEEGETATLTDTRERGINSYIVGKAADGNCWMLQNLKLGNTTRTTTKENFIHNRNRVSVLVTTKVNNATGRGDGNFSLENRIPFVEGFYNSYRDPDYGNRSVFECSEEYGCYYNWYAATAGSGTSSTISGDATNSICPVGWILPSESEFKALINSYGKELNKTNQDIGSILNASDASNTTGNIPGFAKSGYIRGTGGLNISGSDLWLRSASSSKSAYELLVGNNRIGIYENSKNGSAIPVRCVSK